MTPEAILKLSKALAVLFVGVGGLGCVACLPLALESNLAITATTALFFVAGGVLMSGGLISFAILNGQK